MNDLPLVSICIPVYNGEDFIESCLLSAYSQDYKFLEIIISDDDSSDKSLEIVDRIKNKFNKPTYIFKHCPKGIGANWNHCIQQAKGKYIKMLCQDDVLETDCVSKMVALAETDSTIGLVYSKRSLLLQHPKTISKDYIDYYGDLQQHWKTLTLKPVLEGKEYLADQNLLNSPKNKIGEPTATLIKRECFDRVGWFNESLNQLLDMEFWCRLMPHYKIGFIDEVLASFRIHGQQASAKNKAKKAKEEEQLYSAYYKHILPYVHPKNQWKLKKQCHPVLKHLFTLKKTIHGK